MEQILIELLAHPRLEYHQKCNSIEHEFVTGTNIFEWIVVINKVEAPSAETDSQKNKAYLIAQKEYIVCLAEIHVMPQLPTRFRKGMSGITICDGFTL